MTIPPLEKPPRLPDIFFTFFLLGCWSFGGPAAINNIRRVVVDKKKWIGDLDFRHAVAFCNALPGAIVMKTAAYAGLRLRGLAGAGLAFVGFGLPAFLAMSMFSYFYCCTVIPLSIFSGMRTAIVAILFYAAFSLGKTRLRDWRTVPFMLFGVSLFLLHVNAVIVIIVSATCGMFFLRKGDENPAAGPPPLVSPRFRVRWLLAILCIAVAGLAVLRIWYPYLFDLCSTMARVDLMAFGGGFASVPIMYNEFVERQGVISSYNFVTGLILGQATPGPITITATFIGYLAEDWPGAVLATVYVFLPSFLLVCGLSGVYEKIIQKAGVRNALEGIFASFIGFIAGTGVRLIMNGHFTPVQATVSALLFCMLLLRVPAIAVVASGILIASLV